MDIKQKNTTKVIVALIVLAAQLSIVKGSYAQSPTRGILKEIKKELIQEKKEIINVKNQNVIDQVKDIIKEKIKKHIKGKLIEIAGNTLTVQQGQTNFIVNTTDKTEFKRKFGGASTVGEFSPNDQLIVIGNRKAGSTEIDASYIRNMSIQRRFAVFVGEVTAKSANTLTLKTESRGTQTVMISSSTAYKERNKTITLSEIIIGDKIIVKGELWDRVNDKIDAKAILKLASKNLTPTPPVTQTPVDL